MPNAETCDRIRRLSEFMEMVAGGSTGTIHSSDPSKPIFVTTHFDKSYASVHIIRQPAGTGVPNHTHDLDEWIFVLDGKIELIQGGESQILTPGAFSKGENNLDHSVKALVDSIYVIIAMPSLMSEFPALQVGVN